MKTGWIKIVGLAAMIVLMGVGVSFAGGRYKDYGHHGGGYHGYSQHRGGHGYHNGWGHHPQHYRPGYHYNHFYRPYCPPPRVVYPQPGYYFGMSAVQPGVSFGFGVQGY
jgi:hypothetical protein